MNVFVKALIAILIGAVVAFVAERVLEHFGIDPFWGWLLGIVAALIYFFNGPTFNRTV